MLFPEMSIQVYHQDLINKSYWADLLIFVFVFWNAKINIDLFAGPLPRAAPRAGLPEKPCQIPTTTAGEKE